MEDPFEDNGECIMPRNPCGFFIALLFAALSIALSCDRAQAETIVRIGGTGSGLAAMHELAKAYSKKHPEVAVKVAPSLGSGGGVAALRQGALDLAITARPLNDAELGQGAQAAEYARTPFVFAVHGKVPVTDITSQQLIDIYSAKTVKWSNGTPIRLILRPLNDVDTKILKRLSAGLQRAVQLAHERPGMTVAVTNQESADAAARVPGALACATLTEVVAQRRPVKILSYNGVAPTLKNLANGSYQPVKTFYLVTSSKTSAAARHFVSFINSAQGRTILAATGNIPASDGKER